MVAAPVRLAIYDLDRTLTRVPTWSLFLVFAARRRAPWRLLMVPLVGIAAIFKALKLIDRDRLKEIMHRLMLGHRVDAAELAGVADAFADGFERHLLAGARARIAADRAAGWRVVIATAAHEFYARSIACRLGVDDLIATAAQMEDGQVTSAIEGRNVYGVVKLDKIRQWLREQGIAREQATIRFYSDHLSDRPTFEWVEEAFAVNAHAPLLKLARQRGWKILDWRDKD